MQTFALFAAILEIPGVMSNEIIYASMPSF
jgi:hypothetical protein